MSWLFVADGYWPCSAAERIDEDGMGLPCEIEPLGGRAEREAKDDAGEC